MTDRILVFGNGWIGNRLAAEFKAEIVRADITNRIAVQAALERRAPTVVINAAGKTGRPNIDGCEDNPSGTLLVNTAGPILLAEECLSRGIFMVHLGSGCVYEGFGEPFTEDDPPNFFGSIYSRSKALSEAALKNLPVLQLRIRMPFDGTPHPRNLITKLVAYPKIISVANSLTYIDDLLVAADYLIRTRKTGIWNVVNPGAVTHEQILELYRSIVDPNHKFETMTLAELSKVTKAGRSNCVLDAGKLKGAGVILRPVMAALNDAMNQYRKRI